MRVAPLRVPPRVPARLLIRPWARLRRFPRSEDGSMVVFGLLMFLMMLMVAGMSVDLMHVESTRAKLQATCDRAVLAAADLDQTRDAEAVVRDYFASAGLLDELNSVTVDETINSRRVTANADLGIDTHFMSLAGVDELVAPAGCTAQEAVSDIEIVLVLDVSGSMVQNGSQKLANLQRAAREFVQTVLANDTEHRISIAIVPFNGQVNLGPRLAANGTELLAAKFNIADPIATNYGPTYHYLNCVDLPLGAYASPTLSRTAAMPATQLVDTFTSTQLSNAYSHYSNPWNGQTFGTPQWANMWCPPRTQSGGPNAGQSTAGNVVRLPSQSISALQGNIDGLVGVGATSINAGMRWGMTLLDPASRPMFNELIASGNLQGNLSDRPYDFNRENTLKVVVLMTDGENFPEERVNQVNATSGFRTGSSDIWRTRTPLADGSFQYSIFHPSKVNRSGSTPAAVAANIAASRPFWVPHLSQWQSRPWIGVSPDPANPYIDGPQRIATNTNWRLDANGDGVCTNAEDGRGTFNNNTQACWPTWGAQTWPEVWTNLRMSWVAWQLYVRAGVLSSNAAATVSQASYTAQMNLFRTKTDTASGNTPVMDDQLNRMCTQAKTNGVVVYGIAFEVPSASGRSAILNCASSPSHYYDAQGLSITTAFRAIASQINRLRLTP